MVKLKTVDGMQSTKNCNHEIPGHPCVISEATCVSVNLPLLELDVALLNDSQNGGYKVSDLKFSVECPITRRCASF